MQAAPIRWLERTGALIHMKGGPMSETTKHPGICVAESRTAEWAVRWEQDGDLVKTGEREPWLAHVARWQASEGEVVFRRYRVVKTYFAVSFPRMFPGTDDDRRRRQEHYQDVESVTDWVEVPQP